MEKWAEYFEKLLNCEVPVVTFTYGYNEPNDDTYPALSKEDIEQQIKRLKNHKSPGEDLQGEILKHVDSYLDRQYILVNKRSVGARNFTDGLGSSILYMPNSQKRRQASL